MVYTEVDLKTPLQRSFSQWSEFLRQEACFFSSFFHEMFFARTDLRSTPQAQVLIQFLGIVKVLSPPILTLKSRLL